MGRDRLVGTANGFFCLVDMLTENASPRENVKDTIAVIQDLNSGSLSSAALAAESDDTLSEDEGSTDSIDSISNEINSLGINQPSGFMGKSAEVSWLKLLRQELGIDDRSENQALQCIRRERGDYVGPGVNADMVGATYHLDDIDLSLTGNDVKIDVFSIPRKEVADRLLNAYEQTVHQLLPIISWAELWEQYNILYATNDPSRISQYWLMVLNLVFASGSRFFESMGMDPEWKHVESFKRARVLGALDGGTLFKIPTLQDVQALGLMGMYLLGSKHTNRAWNVIGLALRLGHGLGLHLRITDPSLDANMGGLRVRVWYSLIYLESTCSLITGRPSILPHHYTGPIPGSQEGAPAYYYAALVKLAAITTTCQNQLFARQMSNRRLGKVKLRGSIATLSARLGRWKSRLHERLDFQKEHPSDSFVRQRTDLALRYYNTQALIFFPSLVWSERVGPSHECVAAARDTINLVVAHINSGKVQQLPWWCLLHYIVTAESVLMLTMVRADTLEYCQELFEVGCEPMHWLKNIGEIDLAAQRTNAQLCRLLEHTKLAVKRLRGFDIHGAQLAVVE